MKKRNLVIANWKMNPSSFEEGKQLYKMSKFGAKEARNVQVVICPPIVYLQNLSALEKKSSIQKNFGLGAQNIATQEKGAMTGEISAEMVSGAGAKFVIIGHSERRAIGETNEIVKLKLQMAFNSGLLPILCIGEKTRDKDGVHLEFIKNQIKESIGGLQKKNLIGLHIAYEPIWAIGKSYKESMHPTDIHEMTLFIKKVASEVVGKDISDSFKILYGGSVEKENAEEIMRLGNVSGFLVGHASLKKDQFLEILKIVNINK